jgi:hypothetical protein
MLLIYGEHDISDKSIQLTLISNLKEINTAIGIVRCGKIKIQKYPSRE